MDSITKKFLEEFCNSFELNKNKESIAFEHFCNYCCVNKENGIVDIKLNDLSTGSNACGIDGIAIIVNNKLVTSISEIQHQIDTNRSLDVNFVFIQAKTSSTFNNGQILNFFEFTKSSSSSFPYFLSMVAIALNHRYPLYSAKLSLILSNANIKAGKIKNAFIISCLF